MPNQDKEFLLKAIEKAEESLKKGGFPAGAIIVKDGKIIGEGVSVGNLLNDPTSHGEMAAIRDACTNLSTVSLAGATLYASMESCLMCLGAGMWAGISRIVFACAKDKVSPEYYGGEYSTEEINKKMLRPIEVIQIPELEEASLILVRKWENLSN
jgi:tRNA(Arg) A34 adenosine deaminase TadA